VDIGVFDGGLGLHGVIVGDQVKDPKAWNPRKASQNGHRAITPDFIFVVRSD
jgi:hypothetical protein